MKLNMFDSLYLSKIDMYFMDELEDFFDEREKRSKKLKLLIRFPKLASKYEGKLMKIENAKKKKKKKIKVNYVPKPKRKKKDIDNLF